MWYIIEGTVLGVLFVEFFGYWWHRAVEHRGVMGAFIQHRHVGHHERDYPLSGLRRPDYVSAWSWSWLVLAALVLALVWVVGGLTGLWWDALAVTIGGCVWGFLFVSWFHDWYHVENFWMSRWNWFRVKTYNHDIHHMGPYNYGIIFLWFDRLFGTYRDSKGAPVIRDFPDGVSV